MCVACQEFTIAPRQGVAYCLTSLAEENKLLPLTHHTLKMSPHCRVLRDRYQLRPRLRGVRYDIV